MNKNWVLCMLIIVIGCATNKSFSPTQTFVSPRSGFLKQETMTVSFFDSRLDRQYSESIKSAVISHLNRTYPSIQIILLDDEEYFSKPSVNSIHLKINIMGYNAGFGLKTTSGIGLINGKPFTFSGVSDGKWNGITGFTVILYDNRSGEKKYSKNIAQVISKPNVGGYKTAQKSLQDSFQSAMNSLVTFIDQSLL
ncbi:hypothetical protein H8E88_02860 [candidate division KSB1 bacterium]|nr:hypothetical protein [candidate division KSB1 bacterium]